MEAVSQGTEYHGGTPQGIQRTMGPQPRRGTGDRRPLGIPPPVFPGILVLWLFDDRVHLVPLLS